MATGASVMLLTATQAGAVPNPAATTPIATPGVSLTAGGGANAFQPMIDQIIAAQQQITATNSEYPFITDFDRTLLPAYVQSAAMMQLYFNFTQQGLANGYDQTADRFAYLWNASAAEPQNWMNDPNPDTQYTFNALGDKTEIITVHPGPGTEHMSFTAMSGTGTPSGFSSLHAYELTQFTPNSDGSYTIYVSPTEHEGNWVDSSGAETLAIRNSIGEWGLPHNTFDIHLEGQPGFTLPVFSDDQIATMLTNVGTDLPASNASSLLFGVQQATDSLPPNFITPIMGTTEASPGGPLLPGQFGSGVHFELQPDQALILKVPALDAAYSNISIDDAWSAGAPAAIAQSSLNNTQAFHDADGFTYYVVSSQDPGVANWLNNDGLLDGVAVLRWQGVTDAVPGTAPHAQVVDIADVRDYLPSDTPLVTPAERVAELQERLLEYSYVQHQDYNAGWVTANLEYDQIKAAVGATQFNEIFGSQQDVPSVLDRIMSPGLSPDFDSILHIMSTDPSGSLSAIVQNLPLAIKDIELPMVLAALRLDMALASGAGPQELMSLFNQTLTDPATSIFAGIVNARDDLAVSIMNADSYSDLSAGDFSTAWDQLSAFHQSASEMLSAGFTHLFGSFG